MTPELHACLLGAAGVLALVVGTLIVARNPPSTPARLHAAYGGAVAIWLFSLALTSAAQTPERASFWVRMAHVGIGMFPGIAYHLNVSLAGLSHRYRTRIRLHWAFSVVFTALMVLHPGFFDTPRSFSWGTYPAYTAWGAITVGVLCVLMIEILMAYHAARQLNDPRSARYKRATVFLASNALVFVSFIDFLPAYGVEMYPFGYLVISALHAATLYGSVRYQMIEITPAFAASHVLDVVPQGLLVVDTQGLVQMANRQAGRFVGAEASSLVDGPLSSPPYPAELVEALSEPADSSEGREVSYVGPDGQETFLRLGRSVIREREGLMVGELWVLHDTSELRRAEAERGALEDSVRYTQKLGSLGVMAGGIAHDFNNLLVGILGHAELAELKLEGDNAIRPHLAKIASAAERASELTGQMLSYAGPGVALDTPVHINGLVREMADLLETAISKKARLTLDLRADLPLLLGDESQLQQVVLNLITNASEALGSDAGTITVRTSVIGPDDSLSGWESHTGALSPIGYVVLEVADDGAGMDGETMEHIFDPFFTTKTAGRGLGLATVVGIMRNHGGLSRVVSAPGEGTSFSVAFPRTPTVLTSEHEDLEIDPAWNGGGLVLVADDEADVRSVATAMLSSAGFHVLEAVDGRQAVELFQRHFDEITAVVLDRTMPVMSGSEAFAEIRRISDQMPVVFMSGYSSDGVENDIDDHATFLHKPFRASMLTEKVRQAISGQGSHHLQHE